MTRVGATAPENKVLLDGFQKWLETNGLKGKTIKKHVLNVDFYINDYLLYDDCVKAKEGVSSLNGFSIGSFPKKLCSQVKHQQKKQWLLTQKQNISDITTVPLKI